MQRGLDSVLLFRVAQIETLQEAYMQFDRLVQVARAFVTAVTLAGKLAGSPGTQADEYDSTDPTRATRLRNRVGTVESGRQRPRARGPRLGSRASAVLRDYHDRLPAGAFRWQCATDHALANFQNFTDTTRGHSTST
jgi:hypothetical protein